MKKVIFLGLCGVVAYVAFSSGCMDRKPAPVCPVPTKINQTNFTATGFDGVDLLAVVDNSKSMEEEQQILATGFFTLINSLAQPTSDWEYPAVPNLRVAVVSTDMGLQYGADRSIETSPTEVTKCTRLRGDDGDLQLPKGGTIVVDNDVISCEPDGGQCPNEAGWECVDGFCRTNIAGGNIVSCPTQLFGGEDWAETVERDNPNLAQEVACMSHLGKDGCGFEQQLEASLRALETHPGFMKEKNLLAVLVVSDEEDCSIESEGLFDTKEWDYKKKGDQGTWVNVACNYQDPETGQDNSEFLFATDRYKGQWVSLKGGADQAVVFAAIVGVPQTPACQGIGTDIGACLDQPEMEYQIREGENSQKFFAYACTRGSVTEATPGRRYVQIAQDLGKQGYVYSICNADWSQAMKDIAGVIAVAVGSSCYPDSLAWQALSADQQQEQNCTGCGTAKCNLVFEYFYGPEKKNEGCPAYFGELSPDQEKIEFVAAGEETPDRPSAGTYVTCTVPKLPTPFECGGAGGANELYPRSDETTFGWYYCEDPDCDTGIDAEGNKCCKYGVVLTAAAEKESSGHVVKVQCLQEFTFEDTNCQENTYDACNDGKDNDGNGVLDCNNDFTGEKPHRADRNCCVVDDETCEIDPITWETICLDNSAEDPPDACAIQIERCKAAQK